ncbi:MAG: hypothetical protein K1X57_13250 [Gemmataceae bacterium]|nr:hypothetical protein [Gemmataceae bacterium]
MADHHGMGTTMPGPDGKYSAAQIASFQSEDRAAGRAVILLMSAVFTIGLTGSILVCKACWPSSDQSAGQVAPAASKSH